MLLLCPIGWHVASCPPPPQLLVAPLPPNPSCCTSTCPPLVLSLPLVLPLSFSGVVASHLPQLVVLSPLVTPPPSVHLRLCLSLHRRLSSHPSHAICLAGYCVPYQHIVHKHKKKGSYCKSNDSLMDKLINNTQVICMTRTAIKNQAAEVVALC
jgi:hypothetical protein